ncbi:MAG: EAL domain-containing protein [Butyrivibrio sp.]|nr:EAL domain-containing protein [Butyrivibrio sp.]
MWDYSFVIPSMFIITIILVFYFSLPRLSIRMNRTFLHILIIESAVVFFDMVSSWGDENYSQLTPSVLYFLNGCYFVLFYSRSIIFCVFTANIFRLSPTKNRISFILSWLPYLITSLIAISCPWTGLVYSIQADGYHSGPLYDILYFESAFYLTVSFFIMIVRRKNVLKRRHFYCALLYNSIILMGLILRYMFPKLLLMDTFCIMAVIIIYLAFQNPEFYLELRGAIFNSMAFRDYIDENNGNLDHRIFGIQVHNYYEMREIYGGKQMDEGISMISRYMTQTFPKYNAFYFGTGRFVLLGGNDMPYEEVTKAVKERFALPWTSINLELYLEIGIVTLDLNTRVESADSLLNSLLLALDKADNLGSSETVVLSSAELKSDEKETALKRYLEKAVDENKVEVFLQPIVNARTNKIVGAEALSRIRDAEGELIPPGAFIPIAEKNGRINIVGEQVFEKTCRFIKDNDLKSAGIFWVNVNLSPMQFMKVDLAERYSSILEKYGVEPGMVHLEITEESMIDEVLMNRQIQAMGGKGFMFVLDDYGTGYSNLTRLKKCPFINVKLDMSIVWDYYNDPDEILPNMIEAFKHMKSSITAEGIEDEKMAEVMEKIGCDYLQGYHFSKPLPMEEFKAKYIDKS